MGNVAIILVLAVLSVLNIFTSAAPFPPQHGDYGWYPQSHVVLPASIDGVKVWVLNQGLAEPRYIYGGGGYDYDQERLFQEHDLDKVDIRDGPEEEVLGVYEGAVVGVWKGIEYPVGIGGGFVEVPEEMKGKEEKKKKEEREKVKEGGEEMKKEVEPSKGEEAVLKAEEELQKEVDDKEGSVEVGHKVIDVSQDESEEGTEINGEEPQKEVDESFGESDEKEDKSVVGDIRAVPEKIVEVVDIRKTETTEETPKSEEVDALVPLDTKMEKGEEGKSTDEVLVPRGVLPLEGSMTTTSPDVSTDSSEETTSDPEDSAGTTESSLSGF